MKTIPFLFLFLFMGALQGLYAQGALEGRLFDAVMTPLAGVPVSLEGSDIRTLTDANGYFTLTNQPEKRGRLLLHFPDRSPIAVETTGKDRLSIRITENFSAVVLEN